MDTKLVEALHTARQELNSFDVTDWQMDIGGERREWWSETFSQHREELVDKLQEVFEKATLEDNGCLCFETERKMISWRGRRMHVYEVVAYAVAAQLPTPQNVIRHLCHNPRCIHPNHLCIGSQRENNNDEAWRRSKNASADS